MHRVTAASGARQLDYLTSQTPGYTVTASAMDPPVFNSLCKEGGGGREILQQETGDRAECSNDSKETDDMKGGNLFTMFPDTASHTKFFPI